MLLKALSTEPAIIVGLDKKAVKGVEHPFIKSVYRKAIPSSDSMLLLLFWLGLAGPVFE
jgi:hypothetical protein